MFAETARSLLPVMSVGEAFAILDARAEYTLFQKQLLYTHYLIARGDFNGVIDYIYQFDDEMRGYLLNDSLYETWFGNTLHTCAYWNTGTEALNLYRQLVEAGAYPCRDYYDELPWEQHGTVYVNFITNANLTSDGSERCLREFDISYMDIHRFFGGHNVPSSPLPDTLSSGRASDAESDEESVPTLQL
jgi:hypothetical protein